MVLLLFFLLFLMFLLKSQQTKRRNIYSISLKVFFWTEHWLRWKGSVARWLLIWFFFLFVSFFSLIPSSEHVLSCTVLLLLRRELQLLLPRHPHFSHLERPHHGSSRVFPQQKCLPSFFSLFPFCYAVKAVCQPTSLCFQAEQLQSLALERTRVPNGFSSV